MHGISVLTFPTFPLYVPVCAKNTQKSVGNSNTKITQKIGANELRKGVHERSGVEADRTADGRTCTFQGRAGTAGEEGSHHPGAGRGRECKAHWAGRQGQHLYDSQLFFLVFFLYTFFCHSLPLRTKGTNRASFCTFFKIVLDKPHLNVHPLRSSMHSSGTSNHVVQLPTLSFLLPTP